MRTYLKEEEEEGLCFLIIPSFFSLSDDSLFLPTLQATACGVFGYLQLLGFFQEGLIGETRIQGDEETFLVGHAPVLHLVGGKDRLEIILLDGEIPAGDDPVLDVVGAGLRVGREPGRLAQAGGEVSRLLAFPCYSQ